MNLPGVSPLKQQMVHNSFSARVQHARVASVTRHHQAASTASKLTTALSRRDASRTRVAATTSGSDRHSFERSAAAFGTVLLLGSLGPLTYRTLSAVQLPPIRDLFELVIVLFGLSTAVLKYLHGDNIHLELHKARLYLQLGVPKSGPALLPDSIVTRATGDVRGNGAYATRTIPRGTHIADYSGELLSTEAFFERYPDGVGDYVMGIDADCVIDAMAFVTPTDKFHPVHMNHSRHRANVARYYERAKARVAFFALRNILPGEELLYDYGRAYWQGREHLELP